MHWEWQRWCQELSLTDKQFAGPLQHVVVPYFSTGVVRLKTLDITGSFFLGEGAKTHIPFDRSICPSRVRLLDCSVTKLMALHLHRVQIAMCGGARACTVHRILSVCLPFYNLEPCFCVAHERKAGWSWLVGYGLGQDSFLSCERGTRNISFWNLQKQFR
jgi:hypothetical protein